MLNSQSMITCWGYCRTRLVLAFSLSETLITEQKRQGLQGEAVSPLRSAGIGKRMGQASEAEAGASFNLAEIGTNCPELNSCPGLPEEAIDEKSVLCTCREQWGNKKEKRNIVLGHLG